MGEKRKCSESVFRGYRYYPCSRLGRHEHDGKLYCKQHYPPDVEKRKAEQAAKSKKALATYHEQLRRAEVAARFENVLRLIAEGHNDPRSLAQEILDEYDGDHA